MGKKGNHSKSGKVFAKSIAVLVSILLVVAVAVPYGAALAEDGQPDVETAAAMVELTETAPEAADEAVADIPAEVTEEEPVAEKETQVPAEEAPDAVDSETVENAEEAADVSETVIPAEAEPAAAPVTDEPEYKVYTRNFSRVNIKVTVPKGAFSEDVDLLVTPVSENTDKYKTAADALAKDGVVYDGMMAYDIGFRSVATGKEVEPAGAVSVSMSFNKNALDIINDGGIDPGSVTVSHITGGEAETVADAGNGSVKAGVAEDALKSLSADFTVDSFSTFTITWKNGEEDLSATIHWGYYEGSVFKEFDSTTTIDASASSVDLAVNIDGYYYVGSEYKETEDAEAVNMTSSVIRKSENGWTIIVEGSGVAVPVADGSHIYVDYASKDSGSYTPPPAPSGSAGNIAPDTNKKVESNGDGTYTIQLDVVGHEDQAVEKIGANVIVVMDITQSMTTAMPGGGGSRMAAAKSALNTLITTLNPGTGAEQNLINFAAVNFGNDNDYYSGTDWCTTAADMQSYVTRLPNNPSDMGTCWQAGLRGGNVLALEAKSDADLKNNATYVIFVTDGNPNCYAANDDGSGRWYPAQNANFSLAAYNASLNNAVALAGNSNLYGVFVGDAEGYEHLDDLITYAGGVDVINGDTASNIETAFKNIAQTIVDNLGASNVTVDDGIPSLSNVSANVTAGEAGGFEYYITPAEGTQTEWDEAPGATYDDSNGVTWDLGSASLKEGWTYTLKFTVWPSQEAYDTIADLNNGLITMTDEELDKAGIGKNDDGTYYLLTNTHLNTTFTDPNGNVYEEIEEDVVSEAMALPTKTIGVKKIWNNFLDQQNPPDALRLIVTRDGENYLYDKDDEHKNAVEVSAPSWEKDDIFISLGQITKNSDGYKVVETGHDYEIVEPEEYSYRWELTSEVYHPMVINGEATMLVKDEEATGTEGTDYYMIGGSKYKVFDGDSVLKAWNDRRSWLQLEKVVTGTGAPADALFEYSVTITDPDEEDVWFSAFGPDGIVKDLETDATAEEGETGYYYAESGSSFTVKIKAGWTLRFINLKSETTYEIVEQNLPDGFAFEKAEGRTVVDTEAEQDDPEEPTISGMTASGTINVPNVEFYVDYTNKYEETEITVTKAWDDGSDADGIRPSADEFADDISLLVNGDASSDYEPAVTDNGDDTYTIKYTKLPKYIDNEEAEYAVQETTVPDDYEIEGEDTAADGGTITNKHEPSLLTVKVEKVWDDEDNKYGVRPESVSIDLLADGEVVDTAELSEDNDWTYTFDELPKTKDNAEIEYNVDEPEITEGYVKEIKGSFEEGFSVTNTFKPVFGDPPVGKTVTGDEPETDETFTFKLKAVSTTAEGLDGNMPMPEGAKGAQEMTMDIVGSGEKEFGEFPFVKPGTYNYTIEEVKGDAEGYAYDETVYEIVYEVTVGEDNSLECVKKVNGKEIEEPTAKDVMFTNEYKKPAVVETVDINVTKAWSDDNDKDKIRPMSVTIKLLADGTDTGKMIMLNEAGEWKGAFTGLDKLKDGKEIAYTVEEKQVEGYVATISGDAKSGFTVTNTHTSTPVQPKTGDDSSLFLWFGIMAFCIAGLGIVALVYKLRQPARKHGRNR